MKKDDDKVDTKGLLITIFGLILMVLILLNMYLYIYASVSGKDYTPISFTMFMQTIEDMPSFEVLFTNHNLIPNITGDWSVFNFLRDFINLFTDLINIVIYLGQLLLALNVWIITLLGKLFIGVISGVA